MEILTMTEHDLEKIKDRLSEDFDDFWNINILKQELQNPNTKYIVAKQDEQICGFAGILVNVDQVELMNIVVRKDKRHLGIGQKLLEKIIELAKQTDHEILSLEVNSNNTFAKNLYEKNGFETVRIRQKYYNNQDDAIIMNYDLKNK